MKSIKTENQEIESKLDTKSTIVENANEAKFIQPECANIRYSDEELKEFKKLILTKIDDAKIDYELLKDTLSLRDDNGTNDTSPTFKQFEDAVDVLSKEETAQLVMRQKKFIDHLYDALLRIANKTYGICRITGQLIAKERLRSVPHTTMSINAKLNLPGFSI